MLLIEDDTCYLSIIERYLGELVDKIWIVNTWEAAEQFVNESQIFWIDLVIPPQNDDYAYGKIREYRKRKPNAVIFVVTGLPCAQAKEKSLEAGADAFAEKMDVTTQTQVIALMMLALMKAQERGIPESLKFLEKARMLLNEQKPITDTLRKYSK